MKADGRSNRSYGFGVSKDGVICPLLPKRPQILPDWKTALKSALPKWKVSVDAFAAKSVPDEKA